MAFSKAHLYTHEEQALSFFARSISHPARPRIILDILECGPSYVEFLRQRHPLSQPAFVQHIEILRKSRLLEYEESTPFTFYSVQEKTLRHLIKQMQEFIDLLNK